MLKTEFLIIGQGLSGSFLSWELEKAGRDFLVMDDPAGASASRIASGIINPVTGRRIVETWMIDDLLEHSRIAYRELESVLDVPFFSETAVLDFFPTPQMRLAFTDRLATGSRYLSMPEEENDWREYLKYDLGYGLISPAFLVDTAGFVKAFGDKLRHDGNMIETRFEEGACIFDGGLVRYKDIVADKLIFCDGAGGSENKFFRNLPFALNKGEALIVEIPGLPRGRILKKGISIVPWENDLFWVGSSHEWSFETDQPTAVFLERTRANLATFCKLPFRVVDHLAGVRPATLERRPFVGFHPLYPSVGILNGLGTKGCSLAPFFARAFALVLTGHDALMPEADVSRFKGVLSRE